MGGVQSATAAAANGALSTYQCRAAAYALIIHVITIERTHPGRAMAYSWRSPSVPDGNRLHPICRNGIVVPINN